MSIDTQLGPVDTGVDKQWRHLGSPGAPLGTYPALCGTLCTFTQRGRIGAIRGVCPDCLRIAGDSPKKLE